MPDLPDWWPLLVLATAVCLAVIGVQWHEARHIIRETALEDMPGHPEKVAPPPDSGEAEAFGDLAEQLLDEGLAEVAEETGWHE